MFAAHRSWDNPQSMKVKTSIYLSGIFAISAMLVSAQSPKPQHPRLPSLPATACVSAVSEGEVAAGEKFSRVIGGGLSIMIDPLSPKQDENGWDLRVLPTGAHPKVDYAALATPPYQSMNPVVITTEYGFRAQDIVAWNPRHFQFFTKPAQAAAAQHAYDAYML